MSTSLQPGQSGGPRYSYRVVTANGHGVHGRDFRRCADAKERAVALAQVEPYFGPYEVERVQHLEGNGRRYWLRRRSRWVPWDPKCDAAVRKPDWIYGAVV